MKSTNRVSTSLEFEKPNLGMVALCVRRALIAGGVTLSLHSGASVASAFPSSIELSDLDGSDGFVLNGAVDKERTGSSVSGVGDVNGDGNDDLMISGYGINSDKSYVVFGGSSVGVSGELDLGALDGTDGFEILWGENIRRDKVVAGAGDINNDGIEDMLLSVPDFNDVGASFVVFGGLGVGQGGQIHLADLDGSDGFMLAGMSGFTVDGVGDINGDTVDDLIIGDAYASTKGKSYVVFGSAGIGSAGEIALSSLDGSNGFLLEGVNLDDRSGNVSHAGDVNNDGINDLLVGNRGSTNGGSFVLFGGVGIGASGSFALSDLDSSEGFVINGLTGGFLHGNKVSGAGDINDDGISDFMVSAPGAGSPSISGETYLVFGANNIGFSGEVDVSLLDGNNGFVVRGIDFFCASGESLSAAGDVNGDDVDDLFIGAPRAGPSGNTRGEAYVLFGGADVGSSGAIELSALDGADGVLLKGERFENRTGTSISDVGDINSDGIDDLIVGAPGASSIILNNMGASYVVFGRLPDCNGETVTVALSRGDTPTSGNDVILGTAGADVINALGGDDTVCGGAGDDLINGSLGDDWIDGGEGNDEIEGRPGNDVLYGGLGNDVIRGGLGDDEMFGEAGDDSLMGQPGNDTIDGGDGVDDINGGGGSDTIYTGAGATVGSGVFVSGSGGDDTIYGGPDADDIKGSTGADTIYGEGGNDVITGGNGRDEIHGGDGDDNIKGKDSRDTIYGDSGNDILNGGAENDTINGGDGNDELTGSTGNDVLRGDAGSDTLNGGSGGDTLVGGPSSGDECNGQSGVDTAVASCEVVVSVP